MNRKWYVSIVLLLGFLFGVFTVSFANPFKLKGKRSTKVFKVPAGVYRFEVEHKGYSKFEIWFRGKDGQLQVLLAKGVGPYKGEKLVVVPKPKKGKKGEYFLQAKEADGVWIVTIMSIGKDLEKRHFEGEGNGTVVTKMFKLKKGKYAFNVLHQGGREFSAVLYNDKGKKVMELGKAVGYCKEKKTLNLPSGGVFLMEVSPSGKWSIDIEEVIE